MLLYPRLAEFIFCHRASLRDSALLRETARFKGGSRDHRAALRYTRAMTLELTPAIRRQLRALAHHLEPVVLIGDAGLTPAVLREIDVHLKSHELIKVRFAGDDREAREQAMLEICETHDAAPVQHIGKILVVYRPHPEEPAAAKKPVRKRRQPRRTKRSYQG